MIFEYDGALERFQFGLVWCRNRCKQQTQQEYVVTHLQYG